MEVDLPIAWGSDVTACKLCSSTLPGPKAVNLELSTGATVCPVTPESVWVNKCFEVVDPLRARKAFNSPWSIPILLAASMNCFNVSSGSAEDEDSGDGDVSRRVVGTYGVSGDLGVDLGALIGVEST